MELGMDSKMEMGREGRMTLGLGLRFGKSEGGTFSQLCAYSISFYFTILCRVVLCRSRTFSDRSSLYVCSASQNPRFMPRIQVRSIP